MSKTRSNRPNNTTSRIAPRMVFVSKQFVPVNGANGLLSHYAPLDGVTLNVGNNALKRTKDGRRQSALNRLAARRLRALAA